MQRRRRRPASQQTVPFFPAMGVELSSTNMIHVATGMIFKPEE
jgi:hypothetical protein